MKYFKKGIGFFFEGDNIPEGSVELTDEEHQAILSGHYSGRAILVDENGYPYLSPESTEKEKDDLEAEHQRKLRDIALKQTDWTQLPDVPAALKNKYAIYRQELREVPQQKGFPHNIEWPKEP